MSDSPRLLLCTSSYSCWRWPCNASRRHLKTRSSLASVHWTSDVERALVFGGSRNMDLIEREIKVSWEHRVFFTDHVFDPVNRVLREVLAGGENGNFRKALVVVDGALAHAQSGLAEKIRKYFDAYRESVSLVCPPLVKSGGEQAKNSWSHVSEIHAAIDAHHIDRHSCLVTVGGGALL